MYQKEIIYMGLYKDGSRMGSAGFMKVENRDQSSRLCLNVRNIPLSINGRFPIRIYGGSGWKELNGVAIQDGSGSWENHLEENVDRAMIQVMLPGGYLLEGKSKSAPETVALKSTDPANYPMEQSRQDIWSEMDIQRESDGWEHPETVEETGHKTEAPVNVTGREAVEELGRETAEKTERYTVEELGGGTAEKAERFIVEESERETLEETEREAAEGDRKETWQTLSHNLRQEPRPEPEQKVTKMPETIIIKEELPRIKPENIDVMPESIPDYNLKEDKWEQILDTYEQIHPYGDERVYVKLEPKDFVILQSRYQHLVNNSFLLHGFYNYRYVILGKEQDYYLGVPGVFYEREKMVALMFGFEAFECPGGNVRAGEFGYYLRKVEL